MPISPHIARLRALVGTELLQLPSVSVLPVDDAGQVLLVRHADTRLWGVLGGVVELDEDPAAAAVRETLEEIGLRPTLTRLLGAFGGPEYRVPYPNGDRASYVVTAYEATLEGGRPVPDGDEVVEVGWFSSADFTLIELNSLAAALLRDAGCRSG